MLALLQQARVRCCIYGSLRWQCKRSKRECGGVLGCLCLLIINHEVNQQRVRGAWQRYLTMGNYSCLRARLRRVVLTASQGSPHFLTEGHRSYYTTVRRPDILRNVIVSEYVKIYQINKNFLNVLFFHYWQNVLLRPDEMASRAGFRPRVVVWRPLVYVNSIAFPKCIHVLIQRPDFSKDAPRDFAKLKLYDASNCAEFFNTEVYNV